ncbi:hypothetical protein A5707_13475 [Mycobacterium kyorinense]|uniref:Uncharacterized protein n=1 Tax=Mycobacterium kyorinense TaxID=487514 RepID=A0A1A2ZQH0_9MYCO|nr:hypothetical protein [Mycobacterium kyorinense]OBI51717.1 hypothetical protein A5707_13475 [Mycobacterium kyorinense]
MTSGIALLVVAAVVAMPVASDVSKFQGRAAHLGAASDTVIDTSAGLENEVGEGSGDLVSGTGSRGVDGRDNSLVGSLVGLGDRFVYPASATNTFGNRKNRGQGVLPDPLPIDAQIIANPLGYVLVISMTFRSSVSSRAAGLANVRLALQPAFGDLSSGGTAGAFREVQAALLHQLVKLAVNVVLLQSVLQDVLVTLNRNVGLDSLQTAQPGCKSSVMDSSTPLAYVGTTSSDATADLPPGLSSDLLAELAWPVPTGLV